MKKLVLVLVVLAMVLIGCKTINSFLCSPTAQQTEQANIGLAVAQAALTAAAAYVGGGAIVAALSSQAIPIFQKVVQGYCVLQSEWDTAVNTVDQAQATAKSKSMNDTIANLRAVKWSK